MFIKKTPTSMKSHPAIKKSKLRETDSEALIQVAGSRIELETSGL